MASKIDIVSLRLHEFDGECLVSIPLDRVETAEAKACLIKVVEEIRQLDGILYSIYS